VRYSASGAMLGEPRALSYVKGHIFFRAVIFFTPLFFGLVLVRRRSALKGDCAS
jgi:hypothetical protein